MVPKCAIRLAVLLVVLISLVLYERVRKSEIISLNEFIPNTSWASRASSPSGEVHTKPTIFRSNRSVVVERELSNDRAGYSKDAASPADLRHTDDAAYSEFWQSVDLRISPQGLYSETDDIDSVLRALQTAPMTSVIPFTKGTSLKWLITLRGGQKTIFKPHLEDSEQYRKCPCTVGYEQARSEVASFHIDRMMNFRKAPYVSGRVLDVHQEILPVADEEIASFLRTYDNGTVCFSYGCFHCKTPQLFCYRDGLLPGSVMYYVDRPTNIRSGTRRSSYHAFNSLNHVKSLKSLQINNSTYCRTVRQRPPYSDDMLYMDLFDMVVLDYLILHTDRRHAYMQRYGENGSYTHINTLHLDAGFAFCPVHCSRLDYIVSPLRLCCRMRGKTHARLLHISGGAFMREFWSRTRNDPLAPVISDSQLAAVMSRARYMLDVVRKCEGILGNVVLVDT